MPIDWSLVVTIASLFLGGGGLAALWRVRNQGRTDERSLLTDEQVKFRADMAGEIASLRTEIVNLKDANRKLDDRNDALVRENGDLSGRLRFLEEQNADLKNTIMNERSEKEAMKRRIAELEQGLRGVERREQITP